MHVKCPECLRVFDLLKATDTEEWGFGHDCEPPAKAPEGETK